jgi:glyoxylase-like metal-dependent hydrolase (beta-lactamase superfamily II)
LGRPAKSVALSVRATGADVGAMLLVPGGASDVHFGPWLGLPEATLRPEDRSAPVDRFDAPEAVAALRGLFVETGVLHAERADDLDMETRTTLRRAFRERPEEGAARFRALGLRWRTRHVSSLFTVEGGGDRPRGDVSLYELVLRGPVRPRPTDGAWMDLDTLWSSWARGEVVLAPELPTLLRRALGRERGIRPDAPGLWEVAPSVFMLPMKTPTLPPAAFTNVFLVGSGDAVLVEPASPYAREVDRIADFIEERMSFGLAPQAILATHHHPDHIGGAQALSERLGLPLWAHALTAQRLRGVVDFDRLIEDGERIELDGPEPITLEAVHTPGHAPGHLCFHELGSGAMIAGDMVAGVGTILVEPEDGDMTEYLASLSLMEAREPTRLLPAHGGVIADPAACLQHYVRHRYERERKVLWALAEAKRAMTAVELVPTAYDDAPKSVWPLAVRSAEAHLLKLVADGKAKRRDRGYEIC